MRYRREDIVDRAVGVLDEHGLADLSMRRIAAELGLQPSALYHHFASKQELLAAVADELLERGSRPEAGVDSWDARVVALSHELRDAMLAYRDGAELVATVHAFGLGVNGPSRRLAAAVRDAGFDAEFSRAAAMTVLHFVFGHVSDEQTHLQANSVGAIDAAPNDRSGTDSFDLGLSLIVDGIRQRLAAAGSVRPRG
ncbi:TetR/AcrR family transcriptional regulator C-terminal domain-containing protein [Aeromicrobium wangtongii]|uniref:TetR/AcrR family transcriptional regulator C-terminal domain-containing protein n=1 Tax=Aeromicrobium wangtongii TaxID=2969247 RepID=UPI002017F8FF|nr:TetR/AcrR family transcriptional regulator C-terminal domain-containing protein [Aeromicrobium wangtongii]MCL3817382.1 TetR/AcrR family transcriptional regulator C-terminal domain-containing protein [Aeromicrobium wangtongii]